ncbi:MAG: GTPase ObgE [Candidatus Nealsonbacteria bacterium]|nr:GTPase ObgE [Candidatus Nealsonbacteria bacterium]
MLIDEVTIKVKAGDGGRGAQAFNKNINTLGPTGGSGGDGGSVYFEGVSDLGALNQFRYKKELTAEDGKNGKTKLHDGADGSDLILKVPVGTIIHNLTTGQDSEIVSVGQRLFLARGGKGGKGNFLFRSSINTTPMKFQEGLPGQAFDLRLELKFIADVGLVGLPNVGKSSLLNRLTRAKSKVANYLFTTLEPSLGVYYELILADIPGLIEGASQGKGLGDKFLRHIERTKTIFHLISAESADPVADYRVIRSELEAYNKDLLSKQEYVFLSQADMADEKKIGEKIEALSGIGKKAVPISIIDDESMKRVEEILREIIKEKTEAMKISSPSLPPSPASD